MFNLALPMESFLRDRLSFSSVAATGAGGGGDIAQGRTYKVEEKNGSKKLIYVKESSDAIVSLEFPWCTDAGL